MRQGLRLVKDYMPIRHAGIRERCVCLVVVVLVETRNSSIHVSMS